MSKSGKYICEECRNIFETVKQLV